MSWASEARLAQLAADDISPNTLRRLILAKANVDAAGRDGATALFRAAQYGHIECFKVLIQPWIICESSILRVHTMSKDYGLQCLR
jgi:ankyrin repeat protein